MKVPPSCVTCTKIPILGSVSGAPNKDSRCHVARVVRVLEDGCREAAMTQRHCTQHDGLWLVYYLSGWTRGREAELAPMTTEADIQ